jgi:hypothetical protein
LGCSTMASVRMIVEVLGRTLLQRPTVYDMCRFKVMFHQGSTSTELVWRMELALTRTRCRRRIITNSLRTADIGRECSAMEMAWNTVDGENGICSWGHVFTSCDSDVPPSTLFVSGRRCYTRSRVGGTLFSAVGRS